MESKLLNLKGKVKYTNVALNHATEEMKMGKNKKLLKANLEHGVPLFFCTCLMVTLSFLVSMNSELAASALVQKTKQEKPFEIPVRGWGEQFRWSFVDSACQAELKKHKSAMTALNIAYDNDGLWDWGDPKGEGPEVLGKMVDQYADAGARFIVWGCGGDKAWGYTPKVQELWGAKMTRQTVNEHPGWNKAATLLQSYIASGTDPLSLVLKQAKARNLPVLAGFRDVNRYNKHFPNSWYIANPQFHLAPERNPWYPDEFGVNFALPKVREHKLRQWIDVVERYDVDGLFLEFSRSLPFFEKDQPNKIEHMNKLFRLLRKELDRIGNKRGKRLKLAIWLPTPYHLQILRPMFPPDFFDMTAMGLDPEAWIKEGLVDILMPSIYATDLDMPRAGDKPPWVETAKGTSTKVYACVMNIVRETKSGKVYATTAPQTARIIRSLSSQYDGLFLFNSQPYALATVLDLAAAEPDKKGSSANTDSSSGKYGVVQGTVGMRGVRPDEIYNFRSEPAHRVIVSEPPCGKPEIHSLPNGELIATYSRNYLSGMRDPKLPMQNEVRWSCDGGLTWSNPVVPFPVETIGANYEGRLMVLPGGKLLMATVALDGKKRPGPYLSVSSDNGRTWSPSWKLDLSVAWDDGHGWPTRQSVVKPDGSVVLMCNNYYRDTEWRCIAFELSPDLRDIKNHWVVASNCHDQSFLRLESGKWVAVWRIAGLRIDRDQLPYGYIPEWDDDNEGHDFLAATESLDGGRTWTKSRPVTNYMEVPGHLMRLKDGRLLLTYGVRHYPMGVQAMLSSDEGKTWDKSNTFMLAWHGAFCWNAPGWFHPYPNGHPYSAQRQDGKIITVYYRTSDPENYKSTLVEAVIWDVPPADNKNTSKEEKSLTGNKRIKE